MFDLAGFCSMAAFDIADSLIFSFHDILAVGDKSE